MDAVILNVVTVPESCRYAVVALHAAGCMTPSELVDTLFYPTASEAEACWTDKSNSCSHYQRLWCVCVVAGDRDSYLVESADLDKMSLSTIHYIDTFSKTLFKALRLAISAVTEQPGPADDEPAGLCAACQAVYDMGVKAGRESQSK